MKDSIIKIAGRDTLYYAPSTPTSNVIVALHGVGESTWDHLRTRGLGKVAATTEINAHIYLPLWPGGYFPIDGLLVPLETAICAKHGIDGITLLTGLSSGGNVAYQWLASGKLKAKKVAPIATNSSQDNVLGKIATATEVDLWHIHGEVDGVPNQLITSEKFITEYNKRFPGKAKRTVLDNVGHNAWDIVYGSRLTSPTVVGPTPLYTPFDKTLWDWALTPTVIEPPVEPEPDIEDIIDSYYDPITKLLTFVTETGRKVKVTVA
jgi:hypothetical protein